MMKISPNLVIEKKIQETIDEIERLKLELGEDSFDFQVFFSSLAKRLKQLHEDKIELEMNLGYEKLRLRLTGDGIGEGTMSARVLGPLLQSFQSITDNIANSIDNDPFIRGKIPNDILEQSNLMVTDVFAGSFGLELQANLGQLDLSGDPLITKTISKFFELLGTEINSDKILEQVTELGPRTFNHYKSFIEKLDDNKVSFNFDWQSNFYGKTSWSFNSQKIQQLREVLNIIREVNTVELQLEGYLNAGSIRKNTFEIDIMSGGASQLLRGKTKKGLLSEKSIRFGEHVVAHIVKTTANSVSTGREIENYFLKEIDIITE